MDSNKLNQLIKSTIEESIQVKEQVKAELIPSIEKAVDCICQSLQKKKKILVCGNGGSAADAQHMAGELIGRFTIERKPIACIALNTNASVLTAVGNDYDFESIFERKLEALGHEGDVFIGISTSGNSKNVVKAMRKAKEMGVKTIGLLGKDGGQIKNIADISITVGSNNTPRVQESHTMIMHILCELIEKRLFD